MYKNAIATVYFLSINEVLYVVKWIKHLTPTCCFIEPMIFEVRSTFAKFDIQIAMNRKHYFSIKIVHVFQMMHCTLTSLQVYTVAPKLSSWLFHQYIFYTLLHYILIANGKMSIQYLTSWYMTLWHLPTCY